MSRLIELSHISDVDLGPVYVIERHCVIGTEGIYMTDAVLLTLKEPETYFTDTERIREMLCY